MKKFTALLLALTVLLSLAACGKKEEEETLPLITELTEAVTEPAPETTAEPLPEITDAPVWTGEAVEAEEAPAPTAETAAEFELDPKFERVDETVYATRNVNIRMKPTVNSNSPGKLMRGEAAQRIGKSKDGWSAVILEKELRYIASEYLTTKAPQQGGNGGGKVTETAASGTMYTVGAVNLRKGPGTDTPALTQIPKGSAVSQLAICSNGWIKVSYEGTVGYVAGNFLSAKAPAEETVPETTTPAETEPETSAPSTSVPSTSVPETSAPAGTTEPATEPAKTEPPATEPAKTEPPAPDTTASDKA